MMKMQEVRELARLNNLNPGRTTKQKMILAIQSAEGNFPCFGTAYDFECDQYHCLWRKDCFSTVKNIISKHVNQG